MNDNKLTDEAGRLGALARLAVLTTAERGSLPHVTELVRLTLGVPIAAVTFIDSNRQCIRAGIGLPGEDMPREHSICEVTIRSRGPLVVPDVRRRAELATRPLGAVRSYAGVPLSTLEGYQIGALCAADVVPREFAAAEVTILEHLARCVENELELRLAVGLDPLTRLFNRTALFNAIAVGRAHGEAPMSVAIVDLDRFKAINDTFGHNVGDDVLRGAAAVFAETAGNDVAVGRLGGEEFGLFFPGRTPEAAAETLRRCTRQLARMRVAAAPELCVTASGGVSALGDDDVLGAFERADIALYAAKAAGRDRVIAWSPALRPGPRGALALPNLQRPRPRDVEVGPTTAVALQAMWG